MIPADVVAPPRLCYGLQDVDGEPACDGPDVQRVAVAFRDSLEETVRDRFVTDWCAQCRAEADVRFGFALSPAPDARLDDGGPLN